MNTYKSNSNYLFMEIFLISMITIVIIYTLISAVENLMTALSIGLLIVLLYIFLTIKYLNKLIKVEFKESIIRVQYKFRNKIEEIKYSEIIELKYIEASRTPTSNILKYQSKNESIKKLKFYSVVDRTDMMEFVKWIKLKNEKIEFKFSTLDMKLDYEYQKEFGFKYRKVLKKTL